jgi:hypothetical protein
MTGPTPTASTCHGPTGELALASNSAYQPPKRGTARSAPGEADEVCPYRGLATYDVADAFYFFGREAVTEHLVTRLAEQPFGAACWPWSARRDRGSLHSSVPVWSPCWRLACSTCRGPGPGLGWCSPPAPPVAALASRFSEVGGYEGFGAGRGAGEVCPAGDVEFAVGPC